MNTSLALPDSGAWPIGPYSPEAGQLVPGQRNYSATNILDVASIMRIIHHWRWLVLGGSDPGYAAHTPGVPCLGHA